MTVRAVVSDGDLALAHAGWRLGDLTDTPGARAVGSAATRPEPRAGCRCCRCDSLFVQRAWGLWALGVSESPS